MNKQYLLDAYRTNTQDEVNSLYERWAKSYDQELVGHGYATPLRCARALSDHVKRRDEPILDFGCGTGLSGQELINVGLEVIDGCDISPKMVDLAREKGIYRKLWVTDSDSSPVVPIGQYKHIAAVGVISVGAAPISLMDDLIGALPSGGTLTFSFNDHALKDPSFEMRVFEYVDTGAAQLLFKEYGEHIPGIGLKSNVYILQVR